MKVLFSFHAAERMKQRLNIDVSTKFEVDISSNFVKSHSYIHETNNNVCVAFCNKDKSMPIVLVVDKQSRIVRTVYLGRKLVNTNTPFVNECYAKIGVTI
jgi:hypothetical protein